MYWGENAPGLFDSAVSLVEKMKEIGKKHDYSFSMIKTNSELHGLPQKRIRTFYFFWSSPTAPVLGWKKRPRRDLGEYLTEIPESATLQDMFIHKGKVSETFLPYKFILEREGLTHSEFTKKIGRGTIYKYLEKKQLIEDCLSWLKMNHPTEMFYGNRTFVTQLEHIKAKLSKGLGYWDDSPKFMGSYFTAVISKNIEFAVHPTEDRFFSVRELLHLMSMPHDFEIDNIKNVNHICQNVPVNTAQDWAEEVVKFCRGEAEMSSFSFLKQDNISQSLVESYPSPPEHDLDGEDGNSMKRKIRSGLKINKKMKKEEKVLKAHIRNEFKEMKDEMKVEMRNVVKEEMKGMEKLLNINYQFARSIRIEQEKLKSSGQYLVDDKKNILKKDFKKEADDEDDEIQILHIEKRSYKCGGCGLFVFSERQMLLHFNEGCPRVKSL